MSWCYAHGNAVLASSFGNKTYDMVVSTYQMCILMLFNSNDIMSFNEIISTMKFDEETCKKLLVSMMSKNYKVLKREQKDGVDFISLNTDFSSNLNRFTLPSPFVEEVYKKEKVMQDRSIAVDAAIVRIMKSRKKMDHNQLMQDVLSNLHVFKPSV